MPRSPLITQAVRKLSMYFGATTTSEYIAKSKLIAEAQRGNNVDGIKKDDISGGIRAYGSVIDAGNVDVSVGISFEDELAELIFGSRGLYYFDQKVRTLISAGATGLPASEARKNQVKIYGVKDYLDPGKPSEIFVDGQIVDPSGFKEGETPNGRFNDPTKLRPNLYAVNVNNPFLGPSTRDVGALQVFLNGIPNIEFSKCVPYVDIDVISPRSTLQGTDNKSLGEGMTLLKFLNPGTLSEVDRGILGAQSTRISTEAGAITRGGVPLTGAKSSMEMFTSPATLTNLGDRGKEEVPVIDRFRPPMSLGQLQVSNKLRPAGGGLSFATARLEIVIHDRSRLRDFVDFVRPDLYGLTFMDITYGWSHIDGGINSSNVYGTLLDALKVKQRYRIINSSYTFDEVGQVKVSLSLATVGSTDLLFLRMRGNVSIYNELERLARQLSDILQEYQRLPKTPSLSKIDTIAQFTDPNSILSAADDQSVLKQISDSISSNALPSSVKSILRSAYGNVQKKGANNMYVIEEGSLVARYKNATKAEYSTIVSKIPNLSADPFAFDLLAPNGSSTSRFSSMNSALGAKGYLPGALLTESQAEASKLTTVPINPKLTVNEYTRVISDQKNETEFITLGAVFSNIIGAQLAKSRLYDEIQLIFYPFNRHAGAVHSLPVSCFPIETNLFNTALATTAGRVQDLSLRDVIAIINDRFVSFPADRAYLMSNFYNSAKAQKGEAELEKLTITLNKSDIESSIRQIDSKIAELESQRRDTTKEPNELANIGASIDDLKSAKSNLTNIKSNGYKVEPNYESTRDDRLRSVGITDGKFVQPNIQVEVEACPVLDGDNNEIPDKTMLKIHVYDAAQDPFSTLGEILAATRDDQLSVIRGPLSEFNQSAISTAGVGKEAREAALAQIKQAETAGIIEQISSTDGKLYYKVKGTYEQIKGYVSQGMPFVIYGSQNSAITNANLQSNNNAGLGNVMLQRAFNAAGDYDPAAVDAGVPMQIIPSQLSLSTVGCPLFFPMQRIFVDFGTGTTADNVYFVTQIDHTIGNDGFKTDVKMSFGQGFATYTSLSQNLAAALSVINGNVAQSQNTLPVIQDEEIDRSTAVENANTKSKIGTRDGLRKVREAARALDISKLTAQQRLELLQARAEWEVSAKKAGLDRKLREAAAMVDPATQASANQARLDASKAAADAQKAQAEIERVKSLVDELGRSVDALSTQDPTLAQLVFEQEVLPLINPGTA